MQRGWAGRRTRRATGARRVADRVNADGAEAAGRVPCQAPPFLVFIGALGGLVVAPTDGNLKETADQFPEMRRS